MALGVLKGILSLNVLCFIYSRCLVSMTARIIFTPPYFIHDQMLIFVSCFSDLDFPSPCHYASPTRFCLWTTGWASSLLSLYLLWWPSDLLFLRQQAVISETSSLFTLLFCWSLYHSLTLLVGPDLTWALASLMVHPCYLLPPLPIGAEIPWNDYDPTWPSHMLFHVENHFLVPIYVISVDLNLGVASS